MREAQFDPERHHCITFVMPWYPGGSVARALVEGHRFSVHGALAVARDVLDALEYLHTVHGHVHRDVKTSNVLLDEGRQAGYLTDFERCAAMTDGMSAQAVLATVFYMPPEAAPLGRHSARSDIYGVGLVLFEMLNGRIPWEDMDPAKAEARILSGLRAMPDRYLAPSAFGVEVPDDLVRIVRKALSRDPGTRFASARDFLTAINQVRAIDWRRNGGDGLEGEWIGTWPPRARPSERHRYRVTSQTLVKGRDAGRLRVVAEVQKPATLSWRRFGVEDLTIEGSDREALRQLFRDVAAKAAHRRPVR